MRKLFLASMIVLLCASIGSATTYYVKSGGSDAADGLSDATAWATLTKVNSTVTGTSHQVYFKCGDTWSLTGSQYLSVDWGGTAAVPAVIGAYYMVGGTETIGVDPAGAKPIFDGNNNAPGAQTRGLITIAYGLSYVTVKDISLKNSAGTGVHAPQISYSIIDNVDTSDTDSAGTVQNWGTGNLIQNSTIYRANTCADLVLHPEGRELACDSGYWAANITMTHNSNGIARNNLVHHSFGEGIGVYFTCSNMLIEKNTIYNSRAAGIYLANRVTDTTVRYNLVYANADETNIYWRWQSGVLMPGPGIGVDDESYMWSQNPGTCERNSFYGNVVIGASKGFFAWQSYASSYFKDSVVYGNTFIDCGINIHILNRAQNSFIKDNISICQTATGTWPCVHSNLSSPMSGLTFDYNNWSSAAPAGAQGANDVTDDPELVQTSGWRALVGGAVTGREAALSATSPAGVKTGGVVLPFPYSTGLDPRALYTDFSALPPLVTGYDRGATPSIGAFPYFADIPEPPPAAPGILTNPGFELGTAWTFYSDASAAFEESSTTPIAGTKSGHVTITIAGANVQLYQTSVPVTASTQYRLSFVARSNVENREIKLRLHKHGSPYTNYGLNNYLIVLHTTNTTYSFDFTTNASATNDARFAIWFADADVAADQFWFDTMTLEATVIPAAKPITTQRLPVVTTPDFLCTFAQAQTTLEIDTNQAGTIALSGSCYSPTTTVGIGVNSMRLTGSTGLPLPPGTYSDCSYIITAGEVASDPVSITAFTVPPVVAHGLRIN